MQKISETKEFKRLKELVDKNKSQISTESEEE